MALSDPQSVDIGAGAVSLPRVSSGPFSAIYQSADANLAFTLQHEHRTRVRSVARLDVRKTAADELFPDQNTPYTMSLYLVSDVPKYGFTSTEVKDTAVGLFTNLQASTNANLIAWTQKES